MGFLSKIFSRKGNEENVGGMQDYMTLIRVYFQSAIAAEVGITNMAMLPDMRVFKATFHVPTQNNKLGVGEKSQCKKMMRELYNTDDSFSRRSISRFISIVTRCRMCRYICYSSRISRRI